MQGLFLSDRCPHYSVYLQLHSNKPQHRWRTVLPQPYIMNMPIKTDFCATYKAQTVAHKLHNQVGVYTAKLQSSIL